MDTTIDSISIAPKRTCMVYPIPKSNDKYRHETDKYWCGFFVIVFISWIVSWYYVTNGDLENRVRCGTDTNDTLLLLSPETNNNADNIGITKNLSKLFHHEANNKIYISKNSTSSNSSEFVYRKTDNNNISINESDKQTHNTDTQEDTKMELSELFYFYVYIFTCNLSYLDFYVAKLGILVVFLHALAAILFLHISLVAMYRNRLFHNQLSIIGAAFLFIVIIEHLSILYHRSNLIVSPLLPFHKKLVYWVVPEMFFLIICLCRMLSSKAVKIEHNKEFFIERISRNDSHDNSEDVHKNDFEDNFDNNSNDDDDDDDDVFVDDVFVDDLNNDDSKVYNIDDLDKSFSRSKNDNVPEVPSIPFHYYIYAIIFGIPFIVILKLLVISTISILYKVGWGSLYFYIIAFGSFYIGLTIYYFALMLTACATNIFIDKKKFTMHCLNRALYIVSRHHFGTACYHATLIIPRLHATFVMDESEFKIPFNYPFLKERLFVTHGQVYRLLRTMVATRGHDHAESIRELLRLMSSNYTRKEYFQVFESFMTKSTLIFLLSTNCLSIILIRFFGIEDHHFAKAAWVMYLTIMFTYNLVMPFFKTVTDTIGLRLSGRQVIVSRSRDCDEILYGHISLL